MFNHSVGLEDFVGFSKISFIVFFCHVIQFLELIDILFSLLDRLKMFIL
jgi:hypothetical protein